MGLAVITAGLCVVSWFVVKDLWLYTCSRCGAIREETHLIVFGFRVATAGEGVRRGPRTQVYDDLVGLPHEHQWCPFTRSEVRLRWPFRHVVHCGVPPQEAGPPSAMATDVALRVLGLARQWPREERVALFEEMLRCSDIASFLELERLASHRSEKEIRDWYGQRRVGGAGSPPAHGSTPMGTGPTGVR